MNAALGLNYEYVIMDDYDTPLYNREVKYQHDLLNTTCRQYRPLLLAFEKWVRQNGYLDQEVLEIKRIVEKENTQIKRGLQK